MPKTILLTCLGIAGLLLSGCVNVDARPPENLWGDPPPAASVSEADSGSKADLLRENRELHDRIDWLEEQNRRSAKKLRDLQREEEDLRAEMEQIATERDRYKWAAEH